MDITKTRGYDKEQAIPERNTDAEVSWPSTRTELEKQQIEIDKGIDILLNGTKQKKNSGLSTVNCLAYAVAHIYNDMCGTVWFMYLLYFITYTADYGPKVASAALLSGQITDGIAANLIGFLIDKTKTRIGKTTPLFLFGTFLTMPMFFLTFGPCYACDIICSLTSQGSCSSNMYQTILYANYIIVPALLNIGCAAIQVSTMSIIVSITYDQAQRDSLISYRNACTFGSNLFTLSIALLLFEFAPDGIWQFRILVCSITLLGVLAAIFYLYGVPEVALSNKALTQDIKFSTWSIESAGNSVSHWWEWLLAQQFYCYGLAYTLAKMTINVTMMLTPFYLVHVMMFEQSEETPTPLAIASVPLASYFSSMAFTLIISKRLNKYFDQRNRLIGLLISSCLVAISSLPFLWITVRLHWVIYVLVAIQGLGMALGLNITSSLISDMLGRNSKTNAFVYGTYGLFDRFASGAVLTICSTVIEEEKWLRILIGVIPICTMLTACTLVSIANRK
ncbi:unnamed protein product [Moneuplotes crassus]|uniref:Uncharacterized protein n=1 Tax=Euplotes crassus TaxID=5936 RepID=A0AAD1XD43_EUPCR|nr:unnamed protein product [Moneuplotes crassus]